MSTVSDRIVNALIKQPRTINELMPVVFSTPRHVRTCLYRMAQEGRVRRGSPAPRASDRGGVPYYWEVAS